MNSHQNENSSSTDPLERDSTVANMIQTPNLFSGRLCSILRWSPPGVDKWWLRQWIYFHCNYPASHLMNLMYFMFFFMFATFKAYLFSTDDVETQCLAIDNWIILTMKMSGVNSLQFESLKHKFMYLGTRYEISPSPSLYNDNRHVMSLMHTTVKMLYIIIRHLSWYKPQSIRIITPTGTL